MSPPHRGLAGLKGLLRRSRPPVEPRALDEISRMAGCALLQGTQLSLSAPPDRLEFVEIRSLQEYEAYVRHASAVHRSRAALERLLAVRQEPFRCVGFDACVDQVVDFEVDFQYAYARDEDGLLLPNYRERLLSPATGLNCRQRATVLALRHLLRERDPGALRIYATEAVTPFFAFLKRGFSDVVGSEYFGDAVPLGEERRGVRNEDVTRLTFPAASFDMVVTCDVLEHVPAYETAFRELRRVLRPGGFLLATVPFRAHCHDHLIRARLSASGTVEHLLPPELHGDPMNPEGGSLCYQQFGWKLLDDLRAAGFRNASALLVWSYYHGILGGDQILFHAAA